MRRRTRVVAVIGLAIVLAVTVAPPVTVAVAPAYTWAPARVDGGGFMTVLAPSPFTKDLWLAGSDVAGVFRSTDGGRTWLGATVGFEGTDQRKVGAIRVDPFNPKRAWACVGSVRAGGPVGGVVRTTDAGVTWTTVSTSVVCSGGVFEGAGVVGNHPRSTGRLLVPDPGTRSRLWMGTLTDGVWRSTDGGVTWTRRGLDGLPIRGMAQDPAKLDVLYAAVRSPNGDGGVYRTTNANAAVPVWQRMPGPTVGEELVISAGRLFVAAGPEGVWSADLSAAAPQLGPTPSAGLVLEPGTDVMTINAAVAGGSQQVLIGLDFDVPCVDVAESYCPTLFRSTDAGAGWAAVPSDPSGIKVTVGGPSGRVWRQAEHPTSLLGGRNFITSDIQVDPFVKGRLVMAGRTGVWRSTDDGVTWYPTSQGLTVTFHGRPETDLSQTGDILMPTTDWHILGTTDNGTTVNQVTIPVDIATVSRLSGWIGSDAAPVYTGAGPGIDQADVYVSEPAGGPFVPLALGVVAGGRSVMAVAARDVDGQRVVVAIDRVKGVWRKVGAGPWTAVAATPGGRDGTIVARTATLAWAPDGALYAADRGDEASTGVWRSLDAGLTWERITPAMMDIAIDPTAPHRLWLAGAGEVWRVDDARTGTTDAGTLVLSRRTPVPAARLIATDPTGGVVVVTAQVPGPTGEKGTHGKVFTSANSGRTFVVRSTDAVSRGLVEPVGMVVDTAGAIHIATFGFGWWVGRPA